MSKEKINLRKLDELTKNNPLSYEVMVYDVNKGTRKVMKSKTSKKKYTLNQLGETVDKLGSRVDQLGNTVDKLSKKVDQISDALFNFINYATSEFKQLKQDVKILKNDVKGINTRLDYIVRANKLKDLPKHS